MFPSNKVQRNLLVLLIISTAFAAGGESVFAQSTNQASFARENFMNVFMPERLSPANEKKALSFVLQDQFGKNVSVKFPSDKVVVLVFGDREGAEQIEGWVRPLYGKFTNNIYIFGVAELSAVPWIARPVVRGIIRSKSKTPVMLDWSGKISKAYGSQKEKANLFVVDKAGNIIAARRGAASSAALAGLYGEISRVL